MVLHPPVAHARIVFAFTGIAVLAPAQSPWSTPTLTVGAVPGSVEMRVDGAPPGAVVATVIGPGPGSVPLPGGLVLGVALPELFGIAFADGGGMARFAQTFPIATRRGLPFVAQALAFAGGDFRPSAVGGERVPALGAAVDVVVLFGQSNAEGHADGSALAAPLRGPWPTCRMWDGIGQSFAAIEHGVNTRAYGPSFWCGPELVLARRLTADGRLLHIVKFAAPGTTLGPGPGPYDEWDVDAGELYAVLMSRLHTAVATLRAQGLVPRVAGICMMQGESDATTAPLAHGYHARLMRLVGRMRDELQAASLADTAPVPFVVARIHRHLPPMHFPHVAVVQDAQARAVRELSRCVLVDTNACALGPDGLHFDADGVNELGGRFAEGLRALHWR